MKNMNRRAAGCAEKFKGLFAICAAGAAMTTTLLAGLTPAANAGACQGRSATNETVEAGDTDVYHVCFNGREQAAVVVSGDGDTDLDLYVYNAAGTLVAIDEDETDDCVATWYVGRTGTYTIRVRNRGKVYNDYVIATN